MADKIILAAIITYLGYILWDRKNQARGIANFQRRIFRSTLGDEATERLLLTATILMILMTILALLGIIPLR